MTDAPASSSRPALALLPYQRRWLLDRSRFKIGMFARQTGKTFTTTLEIVDDCFRAMAEGRRARWVILSRGERQAREAMEEGVRRHAAAYGVALEALDYPWEGTSHRALEAVMPGGSRITALPANPDTARGFSANVFLDEFAFHRDAAEIWKALFPVVSAGWKLRVTSTPNGKGNKFHELVTGDDPAWSRHRVDIHQAVADGLPRDVAQLRAGLNDPDAWAQEYELQWLDEASAWLPWALITDAEHADAGRPELYQGGPCFVGNDIARHRHLWVAWVWERVGDVLWTREVVELAGASFAEQDSALDRIMARYRVSRLAMDRTGMGEKPVEDAARRYGAARVEGVHLSGSRPLDIATAAKAAFERRALRIPEEAAAIRADLHALRKVTGPTGHPRIVTPEQGGTHADRAWAALLGIAAASDGGQEAAGVTVAPPVRRGWRAW
ncbi:MAG TPA: terminase family protein [Azospirillaceae bacterium]|nr:terminase family protein [Azospirillaceae bacterium]